MFEDSRREDGGESRFDLLEEMREDLQYHSALQLPQEFLEIDGSIVSLG